MTLLADAEDAQDIGAAFNKFLDALPDQAADVTSLIAELYAISAALRELDITIHSREYSHRAYIIKDDLELVCASLSYTLKDAFDILGEIRQSGDAPTVGAYRQTWKDIYKHFLRESRGSLCMRLERYKRFVKELNSILKRSVPNQVVYGDLRNRIEDLVEVQESSPERIATEAANLSLGPQAAPRPRRSWNRERPHHGLASPLSPQSPRAESIPPFAPEPPLSPTLSSSTAPSTSTAATFIDHWATRVFSGDIGTTPLPRSGDASKCYGVELPDAKNILADEYDQLSQITFGGGSDLLVRIFHREEDKRARILCKSRRNSGPSKYCCLPLNTLTVRRADSSLQLCRRTGSDLELWANMKFNTIERMILFFCMFLALRSQDCGKPVLDIKDNELAGETEVYGGQIMDDNFLHALRVFRDRKSKAIRLQASVFRGEMKKTPVWTAFIHRHVSSRGWMRRPGPKIVHLADLRRIIFSDEYTPQRTGRGESVLNFTTAADAQEFVRTIEDLAEASRR